MPIVETRATSKTACVSTAPVFNSSGAEKSADPGWWALVHHNKGGKHPGGNNAVVQTVLWLAWLCGLASTALIPSEDFFAFIAIICALVVSCVFLPDDGSTVLPYYIHVVLPIIAYKSVLYGGMYSFFMFYFIFGVVPLADYIIGVDVANQTKTEQQALQRCFSFKLFTMLIPVFVSAAIIGGSWFLTQTEEGKSLSTLEFWGFSLSVGFYTGAIGIVVGHELCHKASNFERLLGRYLMCLACYGHFYVEHTLGHHKDVATDKDAATARYGEDFYSFLPRVVIGEFQSACRIEAGRLKRKGLPWWKNEIPMYFGVSLGAGLSLRAMFGSKALEFFFLQALWAIILFESVNYLEHYGLERRQNPDGSHETVKPCHSWDSPARLTNMVTIKLQRHADHHAHAGKRFQILQAYDTSPQLPSGYATMIVLAFFPPLWRYVMHPRLMRFRKTQTGQVWRHGPQPEYDDLKKGQGAPKRTKKDGPPKKGSQRKARQRSRGRASQKKDKK